MIKKLLLLSLFALPVSAASIEPGVLLCTTENSIDSVIDGYQTANQNKINAYIKKCAVFDNKLDVDVITWSYSTQYSQIRIYDSFGASDWWVLTSEIIVP